MPRMRCLLVVLLWPILTENKSMISYEGRDSQKMSVDTRQTPSLRMNATPTVLVSGRRNTYLRGCA